jgi:hypothetical protein
MLACNGWIVVDGKFCILKNYVSMCICGGIIVGPWFFIMILSSSCRHDG